MEQNDVMVWNNELILMFDVPGVSFYSVFNVKKISSNLRFLSSFKEMTCYLFVLYLGIKILF